jgi:predicted amidophosphoribosyltransferase
VVGVAGPDCVTVAVGAYSGPLRAALLAYKERGRRELAGPLGALLAAALLAAPGAAPGATSGALSLGAAPGAALPRAALPRAALLGGPCWLVPAPSRASAARARGGHHRLALAARMAELLAPRCAAAGGSIGLTRTLRMRRGGRDSVGLDAAARAANLRGRVLVRADALPPAGASVFLLDDVVTTGATLRGCVAALHGAGVAVSGALVLCDATGGFTYHTQRVAHRSGPLYWLAAVRGTVRNRVRPGGGS